MQDIVSAVNTALVGEFLQGGHDINRVQKMNKM